MLQVGAGHAVRGVIKGLRPEQLEHTFVSVQPESKGGGNFSAKPDEQGAYAVRGVSPGRVRVTAYADSRQKSKTIDVPADQDVVLDIVFPPGVRLSGLVTQGAKPAADRNIWVGSPERQGRHGVSSEDCTRWPL